jgi:hypothetical protein
VLFAIILRLPFVEDLVHRVLQVAVLEIALIDDALAIEFPPNWHRRPVCSTLPLPELWVIESFT